MAKCKSCAVLAEQVKWLREQNQNLADRLMAMSNPQVLPAFRQDANPEMFYGSSEEDQVSAYDEFGQLVSVDKVKTDQ